MLVNQRYHVKSEANLTLTRSMCPSKEKGIRKVDTRRLSPLRSDMLCVVGIADAFQTSVAAAQHALKWGAEPTHPACRCAASPVPGNSKTGGPCARSRAAVGPLPRDFAARHHRPTPSAAHWHRQVGQRAQERSRRRAAPPSMPQECWTPLAARAQKVPGRSTQPVAADPARSARGFRG